MVKRIRYCPKCKSTNVQVKLTKTSAFGVPQNWECLSCGFEAPLFPEEDIEKLEKRLNKKTKRK